MTNLLRIDIVASLLSIAAGVFHLGAYWGLWWSAPDTAGELYLRVIASIVLIVAGTIAFAIFAAITNRKSPVSDERENASNFRAMRNSGFILWGGLAIIFMEAFEIPDPMMLAHGVIGILITTEIVRLGSLFSYLNSDTLN